MALYRYQSGSLLDYAQVFTNDTGGKRAYLHAAAGASSEQLRQIKQALRAQDLKCVPTVQDGKPVLEVRGFQKNEAFLNVISKLGLVSGTPAVTADANDHRTNKDRAKSHSLQWAGVAYVIGDICYMTYATMKHFLEKPELVAAKNKRALFFNKVDILAGMGYALGTAALVTFGGRDQSQNTIDAANKKMYGYLRKEGIEVDDGSTLHATMHEPKRGILGSLFKTVSKFPSETLNSVYIFVGGALASAAFFRASQPIEAHLVGDALRKAKKLQVEEWKELGLGTITASSALAGLAIKEKKPDPNEPKPKTIFGRAVQWVQEKPLRTTGIGFGIATLMHAWSTWGKWKEGDKMVRKSAPWRAGFVVANVVAEIMLAISSKGHGVGVKPDPSIDQTVIASSAELIMRQPAEQHEALINTLAGYMSSRDVLGGKADDIAQQLREHVQLLQKNPWTKHFQSNTGAAFIDHAPETMPANDLAKPSSIVSMPHLQSTGMSANDNDLVNSVAM